MDIDSRKDTLEDFATKFIGTLNVGLRQMAEKAAENNESLVIGYMDGTAASIPAKELLKTLLEKGK